MVKFEGLKAKAKDYVPMVIGATTGLVAMAYVVDQGKAWIPQVVLDPQQQTWALWGLYVGVTVAAVVVWTATRKGADWATRATNAASIAAMAVGGFSILAKGLQWSPITVGRLGAVRGAARPVTVVRRESTPTYAAAPMGESALRF